MYIYDPGINVHLIFICIPTNVKKKKFVFSTPLWNKSSQVDTRFAMRWEGDD
jgi:hypothetical protein